MWGQKSSTTLSPTPWLPDSDTCCTVCDVRSKGGRPKKSSSGHPSTISLHIKSVALPNLPFTLDQVVDNNYIDDVTCNSCRAAVQKSVEVLPCKSLYCCNCALSLASSSSFTCPSCSYTHESIDSTFTKPSSIAEKMINSLYVKCNSCGMNVKVESLQADCHTHMKIHIEELSKAVSELLPQSSQTITVSTGGRVSAYVHSVK